MVQNSDSIVIIAQVLLMISLQTNTEKIEKRATKNVQTKNELNIFILFLKFHY